MGLKNMLAESNSEEEPIWRSDAQDRDMCRLCTTSKHSVLWSIHLISLLYGHFSSNMSIKYLLVWSTCQLDFPALKLYNKFMYSQLLFALQLPPFIVIAFWMMLLMLGTCWIMSTKVDTRSLKRELQWTIRNPVVIKRILWPVTATDPFIKLRWI